MQTLIKLLFFMVLSVNYCCYNAIGQDINPPKWMLKIDNPIAANHFPEVVDPVKVISKKDTMYYWKHNTSFMNTLKKNIRVEEAGAYIYINNQWTLRVKFNTKEFSKLFDCPKGILVPLQPYTFVDNWRTGKQVYPGYALWYVKAKNKNGESFIGYKTLYTSDTIHTQIIK